MGIVRKTGEHELHPDPSNECNEDMAKVEYSFHHCIWVFHKGSLPRDPEVSPHGLNGQPVIPHRPVHRTVDTPGIIAEVSLVPIRDDPTPGKINPCVVIPSVVTA